MRSIGVIFNTNHELHDYMLKGFPSPESPVRLQRIMQHFRDNKVLENNNCKVLNPVSASVQDVLRVHTMDYFSFVQLCSLKGGGWLGNDTYLCEGSLEVLLQAVGSVLEAGKAVATGEHDHAFALIRPPGHHAYADHYSGFCVFNNAAVLARYLQQVRSYSKIAIVNIDAHASDGTQDIFNADPSVLCISVHQDPSHFYPFKGFIREIGFMPAVGYTLNMEMPPEAGNSEYFIFFEEIGLKVIEQFCPDIVILECGFDSYYKEGLSKLNLTMDGYYGIVSSISSKWRTIVLLEGGYHDDIGLLADMVLQALSGNRYTKDEVDQMHLLASRQSSCRRIFESKLNELKTLMSSYWEI
ncbi:histone deacetylase [Methanomethylovorans sp.]|uniref:histone deacetylase family protein n=1 Tax=Methanomethylovorans sp. TaxID=2758717 RepID=UPI000B2C43C3|nr:histone deacetylase [Methanomethylovorans sp.]